MFLRRSGIPFVEVIMSKVRGVGALAAALLFAANISVALAADSSDASQKSQGAAAAGAQSGAEQQQSPAASGKDAAGASSAQPSANQAAAPSEPEPKEH